MRFQWLGTELLDDLWVHRSLSFVLSQLCLVAVKQTLLALVPSSLSQMLYLPSSSATQSTTATPS